jgi:hypothetical protein
MYLDSCEYRLYFFVSIFMTSFPSSLRIILLLVMFLILPNIVEINGKKKAVVVRVRYDERSFWNTAKDNIWLNFLCNFDSEEANKLFLCCGMEIWQLNLPKMLLQLLSLFIFVGFVGSAQYQPNWQSLDARPIPEWY